MRIIIRGSEAAIKKGTSFEYISENRLFTGADSYTLAITFPLAGCTQNLAIFGRLNRADVEKGLVVLDCEIVDRNFVMSGTLLVTEVSETEIKAQFLEGRSEQNYNKTLDSVYINEIVLSDGDGAPDGPNTGAVGVSRGEVIEEAPGSTAGNRPPGGGSISDSKGRRPPTPTPENSTRPSEAWNPANPYVALPWVNNQSGILQNEVVWNETKNEYDWADESKPLSWQMYLLPMAKAFCEAVGYSCNFSAWEQSDYRYLLCCNTLPGAWGVKEVARALPHWTVAEFFEKLELLMSCEFDIDHRARSVTFAFSADVNEQIPPVLLDSVVDEFSAEISTDDKNVEDNYVRAKNLAFADNGHSTWAYDSCEWYLADANPEDWTHGGYMSFQAVVNSWADMKDTDRNVTIRYLSESPMLRYDWEDAMFATIRCVDHKLVKQNGTAGGYSSKFHYVVQPLNRFGPLIMNPDEDDKTEIEFVPVPIDYTDAEHGFVMFLPGSSFDEPSSSTDPTDTSGNVDGYYQPYTIMSIAAGERSEKTEYYSLIYVAFFDGTLPPSHDQTPIPATDKIMLFADWSFVQHPYSLRINLPESEQASYRNAVPKINPRVKYKFSFLASSIPNARALFFIKGKRYVCEKLTATFTENGMSQLIKGEFYMVND